MFYKWLILENKLNIVGYEKLKIDKINDVMDVFVELIEINL